MVTDQLDGVRARLDSLRVNAGDEADLTGRETRDDFGLSDKATGKLLLSHLNDQLYELQRSLWAENQRSVLLVLQGMDTAGKDGTIRGVFRGVNPHGVSVASFGKPTDRELDHDYLWRVHQVVPSRGTIGVFNRSHYEDVGIVWVNRWIDRGERDRRLRQIRDFEQHLAETGTVIRKVFLHISNDEQRERLQERIARPEKHWKFNVGDLEVRNQWDDYMQAYDEAITATSTDAAPWYVVGADRKWARNVAVAALMVRTLEEMAPSPPPANPDLNGLTVT